MEFDQVTFLGPAIDDPEVMDRTPSLGDQYLLRDGRVLRLQAETGEIGEFSHSLPSFLEAVQREPVETLQLQPLLAFWEDGGELEPGELLSVYPPFCTQESAAGVSYRAIPAAERIGFLADFAAQLANHPDDA